MNRIFVILLFLFNVLLYGQDMAKYNAIYTKALLEISQKDFNRALKIADSLYSVSETPVVQTKSLMLTASLYQQTGDREKAIEYALQSENIIRNTDNEIWKARVYGFLTTQYRFLGLYDKSKEYADLTLETCKNITNPEAVNSIMGLMMQELAYYNLGKKNYKTSIEKVNKAQEYFDKTSQDKTFLTANNEQLLGLNYYHLKDFDASFTHYKKALEVSKKISENYITGLAHSGLALVYMEKKDFEKAKQHIDIAQRIADQSKYLALKNEVYTAAEKYYELTKNVEGLIKIDKKQDTLKQVIKKKDEVFINKSYSKIDKQVAEVKKADHAKTIAIIIVVLLLSGGIVYFIHYRKKQKQNIERFKKILEELDKKESAKETALIPENSPIEDNTKSEDIPKTGDTSIMPAATEQKLLAKLQEFEESDLYTNNNISLASLATYCETNIKYLSYVIRNHKDKDFNNYINDLRVNYIINRLRTSPKYRKYKISTLAEEAGFSSPNKFAMIFKKSTSISPSMFIKYLEETNAEQ